MNTYRILFYGRLAGAIGPTYSMVAEREGKDFEEARLALYDRYEHVLVKHYYNVTLQNSVDINDKGEL